MNKGLKPCPFCGSEAVMKSDRYDENFWVQCSNGRCFVDGTFAHGTKEAAAEEWNMRVERTCIYEYWEFQINDYSSYHAWNCSNCGGVSYDFEEPPIFCPDCGCKVVEE